MIKNILKYDIQMSYEYNIKFFILFYVSKV